MATLDDDRRRLRDHLDGSDAHVAAFLARLKGFLNAELRGVVEQLRKGERSGREASAALGSLISNLEAAGLDAEVRKLRTIYGFELKAVRDTFETLGAKQVFSSTDNTVVETLIDFDVDKIASHVKADAEDLKATLMRSVLIPGEKDLFEIVEGRLGSLEGNLNTEMQTMVQAFSRTVTAKKAEDLGFNLMIYLGPDDKITRPFCRKLLGKDPAIYTLDEIKGMSNGQDLPVLQYAGGYKCRHQWRPVSEERARELGWE